MFEVWGKFISNDKRNERLQKYFSKMFFDSDSLPLVPPSPKVWESYIEEADKIILTFNFFRYENSPYVTLNQLKSALSEFSDYKSKTLVSISPLCDDFNLKTGAKSSCTLNQAELKARIKNSEIFYSEEIGASYFTYGKENPHLVWLENTKSIAEKHNLIKSEGFCGIFFENPYALLEGNWESLYAINKKRGC